MSFGVMEPVHILLQARMNSTRLPGKALMRVGGIPSAVLAAKRAMRGGKAGLTVATAEDSSCDRLAEAMAAADLTVFRGSENDVLGRFAAATEGLPPQTILVRLTADNVFPDGDFVQMLVTALRETDADIVGTASANGLPYGLSAEAMRLSSLRAANTAATQTQDREHVTPWLYRHAKNGTFAALDGAWSLAGIRCTLDNAQDYHTLLRVFEDVCDPVAIGWRELVERLAALAPQSEIAQ